VASHEENHNTMTIGTNGAENNASARIAQLAEAVNRSVRDADSLSNVNSDDIASISSLITAVSSLLEIVQQQEERNQQVATALDALAASIGYPINNPREMREQVRSIAAVVRGK